MRDGHTIVLPAAGYYCVKMSTIETLRAFVNQRLTAAVEDILGLLETTISNYEEVIDRQRRLLEDTVRTDGHTDTADGANCFKGQRTKDGALGCDCVANGLHGSLVSQEAPMEARTGFLPPVVQELTVRKDDQRESGTALDQDDPAETPHIKEEQEEPWSSQEGEKFTAVSVKSEDEEETDQSSQLHQRQSWENTEAEPAAGSSAQHMEKKTDSSHQLQSLYCCESETEDSNDDWKETREQESGSDTLKHENSVNHNKSHGHERPFSCTVCDKRFGCKGNLHAHMRSHTGEKPFTCTVCNKSFSAKVNLKTHMRSHTGEKPFSCSMCSKSFSQKKTLVIHLRSHTGERPFSCSFCGKRFSEKGTLKRHIRVHTGEKPYSCSVCGRNFSLLSHVKSHKCAGVSSNK